MSTLSRFLDFNRDFPRGCLSSFSGHTWEAENFFSAAKKPCPRLENAAREEGC